MLLQKDIILHQSLACNGKQGIKYSRVVGMEHQVENETARNFTCLQSDMNYVWVINHISAQFILAVNKHITSSCYDKASKQCHVTIREWLECTKNNLTALLESDLLRLTLPQLNSMVLFISINVLWKDFCRCFDKVYLEKSVRQWSFRATNINGLWRTISLYLCQSWRTLSCIPAFKFYHKSNCII